MYREDMPTKVTTARAVPVPDRKALDRYGNPTRWILKIVDPPELRGIIAFPEGFEPRPGHEYVVEIAKHGRSYAVVRLHEHRWEVERREEDPYTVRIALRCRCGEKDYRYVEKFSAPIASEGRWYISYALELRRRARELAASVPPVRYYYVAARDAGAAERLLAALGRRTLDETYPELCRWNAVEVYDSEAGKWREVEAWRGADDKSWLCTEYPPAGYVPVLGWIDAAAYRRAAEMRAEAERLWRVSEDVLGQRIDVGRCLPDGRGGCRRYASALAELLGLA